MTQDGRIGRSVSVGRFPLSLALGLRDLWVSSPSRGTLLRMDRRRMTVSGHEVRVGRDPQAVAYGFGEVSVANEGDATSCASGRPRDDWSSETMAEEAERTSAPTNPSAPRQGTVSPSPDGSRRRRATIAVGALVGATGVIVAAMVLWLGAADSPQAVDEPLRLGASPSGMALHGDRTLFVAQAGDDSIVRVDTGLNRVLGPPIRVGDRPQGLTVGGGSVWATGHDDDTLSRVDPATGRVLARIGVGAAPTDVEVAEGRVWVASFDDDTVEAVDPRRNRRVGRPIPVGEGPKEIAASPRALWVASGKDNAVTRIDPRSERVVARIALDEPASGVAAGDEGVWVSCANASTVVEIDPRTNRTVGRPIRVGSSPVALAVGAGAVWVPVAVDHTVAVVDPRSRRVVDRLRQVGTAPGRVLVGPSAAWVTGSESDTLTRVRLGIAQ